MRYGALSVFTFDLTPDQRRLCAWVAERASEGVCRVHYADVKDALGIATDRDLTHLLKEIRERVDEVHEMVHFPIVNTRSPYFDIDMNAGYIWNAYCRAEEEIAGADYGNQSDETAITHEAEYICAACVV